MTEKQRTYAVPARKIKSQKSRNGYKVVKLQVSGETKSLRVNRLMLMAWVGPPPTDKHQARHLDDDKSNNVLSNLQWGTRAENYQDSVRNGTAAHGERHGRSKMTADSVRALRADREAGMSSPQLSKKYGIHKQTVMQIVRRETWKEV